MKIPFENKVEKYTCIAKLLTSLCLTFLLFSCATVDTRHAPTGQPATSDAGESEPTATQSQATTPPVVDKKTDSTNEKVVAIAGAVVATVATIWVVTEFIEEKVIPAVLGLTVAYLLYQASRNNESRQEN